MALEAVVFQQDQLFGYNGKDLYNLLGGNWSCDFSLEKEEERGSFEILDTRTETTCHYGNWNSSPPSMVPPHFVTSELHHHLNSPSEADLSNGLLSPGEPQQSDGPSVVVARPKRRRSKTRKNKEDIENQRMTHIAVERNRRKQMNEYLSVLRSLMPDSYVQRGDQASIIGGAINFVKELEQRLQFLGTQKETKEKSESTGGGSGGGASSLPFSEFFTFPQYSTTLSPGESSVAMSGGGVVADNKSAIADVEVTMVESHANLKIRSRRRPKQLLKVVSGLQILRLTILHLNVTTVDQIVLYSLSVKVEDECRLSSVDEIATAVHQLLCRIQEEAMLN